MDNAIKELDTLIREELLKNEVIIDRIYFDDSNIKNKLLTVVLDKVGGINLEEIVKSARFINEVIDKMDFPSEDYTLDCISKERG